MSQIEEERSDMEEITMDDEADETMEGIVNEDEFEETTKVLEDHFQKLKKSDYPSSNVKNFVNLFLPSTKEYEEHYEQFLEFDKKNKIFLDNFVEGIPEKTKNNFKKEFSHIQSLKFSIFAMKRKTDMLDAKQKIIDLSEENHAKEGDTNEKLEKEDEFR